MNQRRFAFLLGALGLLANAGCSPKHDSHGFDSNREPPTPIPTPPPLPPPPPPPPPTPPRAPVPSVTVLSIHVSHAAKSPTELTADVKNFGPGKAEVSGSCEFTCPAPIHMLTGFLQTESGAIINVGEVKTLPPGGGVSEVCDGRPGLPLQMNCKFLVEPFPRNGNRSFVEYHQSVAAPP